MSWSKDTLPSRHTTEGVANSFHRVFYYAMGLTTEEIHQPHVGVVTAWDDTAAVHDDVRAVADRVKDQLWGHDLTPREFTTIPGFDGADPTARPLLVSRELIADSTELTVRGHCYDALVGVGASSIALAGLAMAACRLDLPCVLVPVLDPDDRPGSADAAATAAALAALGLTADAGTDAPSAAAIRTVGDRVAAGLADRLRTSTRARSGVSAGSLAAAARAIGPLAATVEPFLHLVALANECGGAGDVPALVREAGSDRFVAVTGSLAPGGAVVSAVPGAGADGWVGPARVAETEEAAIALIDEGALAPGDVVVLRGQGPRGGPGLPSCERLLDRCADLAATGAAPVVVTDGRAPARAGVVVVSAVTPEAAAGGPLAGVGDGDRVTIDLAAGTVDVEAAHDGDPWPHAPSTLASPVLWKYAELVGPASAGALTHPGAASEQHRYADL